MTELARRSWVPGLCEDYVQDIASRCAAMDAAALEAEIDRLIDRNRTIHERACVNLNPATNVMSPKAEAVLMEGEAPEDVAGAVTDFRQRFTSLHFMR